MNHTNSHETPKNLKKNKDAMKSPQELYDRYIKKGDEAVIAEDLVLAEKYYQHADHYLRLMNGPNHFESDPEIRHLSSSRSMEELIVKALKGIAAEKVAREEAFRVKAIEVAKAVKAAWTEKKDKAVKTNPAPAKALNGKKVVNKKPKNSDEPCKIIPIPFPF